MNSSKNRTNEFIFTSMLCVFVSFLEEIEDAEKVFRNHLTFNWWISKWDYWFWITVCVLSIIHTGRSLFLMRMSLIVKSSPWALSISWCKFRQFTDCLDGSFHSIYIRTVMPCPIIGHKMFCVSPNFWCETKKVFTYCGSHKHFEPDKKMIRIQ